MGAFAWVGVFPAELLGESRLEALQPIAGRFVFEADRLVFVPRFPFFAGRAYAVAVFGPAPDHRLQSSWTIARPAPALTPAAEVTTIYPTSAVAPVNLLKLYVAFSAPMSEGWAGRAVTVERVSDGAPLEGVFVDGPELWDAQRRRLTLLLDPGRIKRGLVPNEQAGYPLSEGEAVTVVVGEQFRDAAGQPLLASARRRYEVGPPLRTRVDPARWLLRAPACGGRDPLGVTFDRPLDRALLEHCLRVEGPGGAPLAGNTSITPGERSWRFAPASPWAGGAHTLRIDPRLEDLAGNSLTRVFDRDLALAADTPASGPRTALAFAPGV